MPLSPITARIIAAEEMKCKGTVAGAEIYAMWYRNHPLLAALDGLVRLAEYQHREFGSRIADDYFTGPLWLEAIKNVRGMFSSASPAGFEAGTCERIFWEAMELAGYTEADL
jgi:hypothetical protein